ncbi:hypothetical protein LGR54_25000 [Ancylobacter sp. Lp-2]|uniref:hypothetical protein n=1 Tax=Ancylobacter sp. Lp-2 TaxID=2881339 RepID=UPI001E3EC09D|nr:hypothetical protein [Ancylobacter sp. Lp-2]MCB4771873.1 hypothetical protein [Ancylobacter sp. Lp-2]
MTEEEVRASIGGLAVRAIAGVLCGMFCWAAPALAQQPSLFVPWQTSPLVPPSVSPSPLTPSSPPLVLLLDGLGVYVETDYVGVSALSRPLRQQGFRTLSDTHFLNRQAGAVPDVVIGHSLGGSTALSFARDLVRRGHRAPLVITIDAAPGSPACPVERCINIHGPGFPNVRGARNIDAWAAGARFVNHASLPTHPAVEALILDQTASFMAQWRSAQMERPAEGAPGQSRPKGG